MLDRFHTREDAILLATFAHSKATRWNGEPYVNHPIRVMTLVKMRGGDEVTQTAAVLHDVTEDTTFTPAMLLDLGFAPEVVRLVKLVDRDYSEAVFMGRLMDRYQGAVEMTPHLKAQ